MATLTTKGNTQEEIKCCTVVDAEMAVMGNASHQRGKKDRYMLVNRCNLHRGIEVA